MGCPPWLENLPKILGTLEDQSDIQKRQFAEEVVVSEECRRGGKKEEGRGKKKYAA